jgi:dipeptidyl aminopeptidase/acylaminoacyl peptidase
MPEAPRPLDSDDLFDLQFLRDARVSPDGRHVAYGVSRTNDAEHFEIWIEELRTRQKRRLEFSGNASAPRWSPDGRWLAFCGNKRLHVAAFPALAIGEPLTPEKLPVQGSASWSPDSESLAVCLLEHRVAEGPRRVTSNSFRADGLGYFDSFAQRIYIVDRCGSAPRCLTANLQVCTAPDWSPCGKRLLCLAGEDGGAFAQFPTRLLTIELESGGITEMLPGRWSFQSARWLPDGEHIAVVGGRDSVFTTPIFLLWVVDVRDRQPHLRTGGMNGNVGSIMHHDMPAWDLTQENTLRILDADTAFVSVQNGGCVEIWRVSLRGQVRMEPVLQGERTCIVLDVHGRTNLLLYAVSDLHSPPELCRATLDTFSEERLTAFNDDVIPRWAGFTTEHFHYQSWDGLEIEAWYLVPAGRQGPLPTVLFIHGGPCASTGHVFRFDFLLLASRGYGVLFANYRGSSGYSEAFRRAVLGNWGNSYPDHIGAVDAAVMRGYADPARLGVWGPSYGGLSTCWIVGHTKRFKAAIAEAASVNAVTHYYLSDLPDLQIRHLGGRPHEIPDIYRASSPITFAHRCTTPTMLLHGEDDLRCPISEAEQFHRALLDAGCVTELCRIPRCSHLGDSVGPLSARRAQNEALVRWFEEHL